MKWYIRALKRALNYSDRARRKEYWMFTLFNFLIFSASMLMLYWSMGSTLLTGNEIGVLAIVSMIIFGVFGFYSWLASISLTVRRMHDIGLSGWNLLYFIVPPFIVGAIGGIFSEESGIIVFFNAAVSIVLFVFSLYISLKSSKEANHWGPPANELDI